MYYLLGVNEIIKVVRKITACEDKTANLHTLALLSSYNEFLQNTSVFEVKIDWLEIKLINVAQLKYIAPKFHKARKKHHGEDSKLLNSRLENGFFENGLLKLFLLDKELYFLAKFIIKIILFNHLAIYTNGTTNETIGVASIDFKDSFNESDFIELVFHQLIHMVLFMDNRCNSHIDKPLENTMIETNLVYKLGGNKFPAYIAFHSFIVGVEVLNFRKSTDTLLFEGNYHGRTNRLFRIGNEFKTSLEKNYHLFNFRGKEILNKAFESFKEIKAIYYPKFGS